MGNTNPVSRKSSGVRITIGEYEGAYMQYSSFGQLLIGNEFHNFKLIDRKRRRME